MWGADREQHAPGSLYLCQPSAHIPPWQTGLKSRWRDTGRERYVRCVGVDEKDQTQNRRTALFFSFCFFTSRDLITAARESQPARPLRSGWGKCSQAVRAAFGGSVVSKSGSRAKKVKGGASGRQEKVKKWDMVGGEGWWESPFLSSSLAESLNWYLFVCHHAWLHAHTNTHTHTHTHTHTKQAHIQQTKAPGHFRSWYLTPWVSFKAWKEVVWTSCDIHPSSVCSVVPTLKDWATGLHGGRSHFYKKHEISTQERELR